MKQPHYLENWLRSACRQLVEPGVQLEFVADVAETDAAKSQPRLTGEVAWQREFRLGAARQGALRIRVDHSVALQESFLTLCHFGEHLAHVAEEQSERHPVELMRLDAEHGNSRAAEQPGQELIDRTLSSIVEMSGYRGAACFLLDGSGRQLSLKSYRHQSLEPILRAERLLEESPFDLQAFSTGTTPCRRDDPVAREWLPANVDTGLCLPLKVRTGAVGTVWVYDRRRRGLHDRDYHLIQSLVSQLGKSLEEQLLQIQSSTHRRLKAELRLAASTQPTGHLHYANPDVGLEAYGCCLSRYELGGDLCEICPLPGDRLFVAVGDASGNSLPAAMVMTAVRGALYALLQRFQSQPEVEFAPAQFVGELNGMLARLTEANQFMSFICGIIDPGQRTFTYCNAGHPQPIHLSEGRLEYLHSSGLLMGIDGDVIYSQNQVTLNSDDVLVIYSDGVSEALNESNRLFRQDGIAEAALSSESQSARGIFEAIWSGMHTHLDRDHSSDDATTLVIKL
ncbi:PP2C family protein-serine/threonine phosphatase [Rubinisphaera margarita]|uniref:PP2C family protein-serine/threonine phosphatase n=1 Tax=Rubinisphaera margarita TaxID=2909586 RepID=UPI001EE89E2D|nr:GAF domain-containing SpoIIE family protein phosphatase [Rubinisphaera margarita]MCG6154565.1 SpoIIE family protein phosphatase [Rubinisphaera margarita]